MLMWVLNLDFAAGPTDVTASEAWRQNVILLKII